MSFCLWVLLYVYMMDSNTSVNLKVMGKCIVACGVLPYVYVIDGIVKQLSVKWFNLVRKSDFIGVRMQHNINTHLDLLKNIAYDVYVNISDRNGRFALVLLMLWGP